MNRSLLFSALLALPLLTSVPVLAQECPTGCVSLVQQRDYDRDDDRRDRSRRDYDRQDDDRGRYDRDHDRRRWGHSQGHEDSGWRRMFERNDDHHRGRGRDRDEDDHRGYGDRRRD